MNNIQATLENLIKTNNGFFKSEKQAKFLISELKKEFGNVFTASAFGNSVVLTYNFDDKGITEKLNTSLKKQSEKVVWNRKVEGVLSVEDKKKMAALKREIKKLEKSINERNAAYNDGQYEGYEALYNKANNEALDKLQTFKDQLKSLENN